MAGKKRVTDAQVLAAQEIYKAAEDKYTGEIERLKREILATAEFHEALGAIKKIQVDREFDRVMESMLLWKLHKNGRYKELGLTWSEVCQRLGVAERSAYRIVEEVRGLYDQFSAKVAEFLGLKFNEIKMLGRAVSANLAEIEEEHIIYKDHKIPINDTEALQTMLDDIREEMKRLKEEADADIKALKRVSESKDEVIHKLEKEIQKLEGQAKSSGLTIDEQTFLKKIETFRRAFDGVMVMVDPERMEDLSKDKEPTKRMKIAYIELLDYMRRQLNIAYEFAIDAYGGPDIYPESSVWEPPVEARA